jgi:hypothetical protein
MIKNVDLCSSGPLHQNRNDKNAEEEYGITVDNNVISRLQHCRRKSFVGGSTVVQKVINR